jgi:photosystem II stability/assembly factor-like uncharacterized protein
MHRCVVLAAQLLLSLLLPLARPAAAGVDRWTRVGPETGVVRTLAAAPSSPSTVYAGLDSGGVFRSGDGGATWSFAGAGLNLQNDEVRSLAVDARRPDLLWAATSQGIYRSANGGASWSRVHAGGATALAQDPASGTLYAGTEGGPMLRSLDGGVSWPALAGSPQHVTTLAIDPSHPQTLYAGTGSGLLKSTNGGAKWVPLTRGLPASPAVTALAIAPRSPQTLYLATASVIPGQIVFRSDDGGARWTSVDGGMLPGYTYDLAVQPGKRETVWAVSTGRLFRSLDRGRTWDATDSGLPGDDSATTILPGASTLLAGTGSGVFRSANQGASWSSSNRGIDAAWISGLALDPLRPMRLWASTNRVYRTGNGGGQWALLTGAPSPADVVGPLTADPHHPGTAYLGLLGAVARTVDAGNHWSVGSALFCLQPRTIAVDPLDSSVIYAAGDFFDTPCGEQPNACDSFRGDDAGQHWTCIHLGEFLAPDPLQPSRVYALASDDLYVSADRGGSWTLLAAGVKLSLLVPDPQRPGTLWGGGASGLSRSDDGGRTWRPAEDGIPANTQITALTLDPVDREVLYAATLRRGVFKSSDGGLTWAPLGTGLEGLTVRFLVIDPRSRNTLYVSSNEAGVLKLRQSSGS